MVAAVLLRGTPCVRGAWWRAGFGASCLVCPIPVSAARVAGQRPLQVHTGNKHWPSQKIIQILSKKRAAESAAQQAARARPAPESGGDPGEPGEESPTHGVLEERRARQEQ
ncbi:hypothetical protein NDU88_002304 [Pleurodeles waltl]|uniref:Uncharacterized protein n=1 Tax=Pleurodeles waltl TaxID=8319 RepID=A0AAV7P6E9_PLEWA|nr:hypothetical protein NDU88_002304 [Pleurodeles waltl]